LDWISLYSARRSGDGPQKEANPDTLRTSYIRDYDRIIFSSAFRRLQNKTQVFPLPGAVFVHNRLTHSLEVASVGRSMGKAVGERIAAGLDNAEAIDFYRHELHSVIAAACLAHDIGNPPFGHSGEDAIRAFFLAQDGLKSRLSPEQLADFTSFEGNSNALRTLAHSFGNAGGYKLTYATLASIIKYPSSAIEGFNKRTGLIATRKAGFFCSELETYKDIAAVLGIPKKEGYEAVYARHPFVYLTEAADDICYRVIDLEDAHRLRHVSLAEFTGLFLPFFSESGDAYGSQGYVQRKMDELPDENEKVQYLRAVWIGLMVGKITEVFMANEEALLAGNLEKDLLQCLPPKDVALIKAINAFSVERIYNNRSVIEIEVAGYHVIGGLLDEFMSAVLQPKHSKSEKALLLIPRQFPVVGKEETLYADLQSVVDYIAGMTDLYALDLYRKMKGIAIPELR
jgi:dGTPase